MVTDRCGRTPQCWPKPKGPHTIGDPCFFCAMVRSPQPFPPACFAPFSSVTIRQYAAVRLLYITRPRQMTLAPLFTTFECKRSDNSQSLATISCFMWSAILVISLHEHVLHEDGDELPSMSRDEHNHLFPAGMVSGRLTLRDSS